MTNPVSVHFEVPSTFHEVGHLMDHLGDRGVLISGGTFVNSNEFQLGDRVLISLERVLGRSIHWEKELRIDAGCCLQDLIDDPKMPKSLKDSCELISSRQIRNMATVGGHIATLQTTGGLLTVLLACDARVTVYGVKSLKLSDYVKNPIRGILTSVSLPPETLSSVFLFERKSALSRPTLTIAASVLDGATGLKSLKLALGGVWNTPVRLVGLEHSLNKVDDMEDGDGEQIVASWAERSKKCFASSYQGSRIVDLILDAIDGAMSGEGG